MKCDLCTIGLNNRDYSAQGGVCIVCITIRRSDVKNRIKFLLEQAQLEPEHSLCYDDVYAKVENLARTFNRLGGKK